MPYKKKHSVAHQVKPADRAFRWMSSTQGDEKVLSALQDAMSDFYEKEEQRECYQSMLNEIEQGTLTPGLTDQKLTEFICKSAPCDVLEVGCGNGRIYRQLRRNGYQGNYVGVEVADYIVEANRASHSEAMWQTAGAYDLPVASHSVSMVFALFVLEHLVYPACGLDEMLRVVEPGGQLVLVFPDFGVSGRLHSQKLGYSTGTARQKLQSGKMIDAAVSLFDSRVRLPRALHHAPDWYGPFPVNTRPLCLTHRNHMASDVDAVYIASKREVAAWAETNKCTVRFPEGTDGRYAEVAFMAIQKDSDKPQ